MAKLVVVIVSWNTCELTRNCLRSLFDDLKDVDSEVWVVDNNSSDSSVGMIKQEFPQAILIENKKNVGFARANNQALRKAGGDYYLLLNPDTVIPESSIGALLDFMSSRPEVGAAAPAQRNGDGAVINYSARLPGLKDELRECLRYHFFPINRILKPLFIRGNPIRTFNQPVQADVLSAACLIIRKEAMAKVGYLSEEYFLFSEENDYFTRMKQAGMTSYYLPNIEILHLVGKSREKRGDADSQLNFFRSRLTYFQKFQPDKIFFFKLMYFFFFGWSLVVAALKRTVRAGRDSDSFDAYLKLLGALRGGPKLDIDNLELDT